MLIEPLADEQLNTVYSPILSPLAWDLGHIANFEELWLVQRVGGREPMRRRARPPLRRDREPAPGPQRAPDPARRRAARLHGRGSARARSRSSTRSTSTPMTRSSCSAAASSTRCSSPTSTSTTRPCCSCCRWSTATSRPIAIPSVAAEPVAGRPRDGRGSRAAQLRGRCPAGGASPTTTSAPATRSSSRPFEIDRTPTTNAAFAEFIADSGAEPPLYWRREDGAWLDPPTFGCRPPGLDPALPVVHVKLRRGCRRFAAWAGKRLPTELEWGGRGPPAPTASAPTSTCSATAPPPAGAYGDAPPEGGGGADARRRLGVDRE